MTHGEFQQRYEEEGDKERARYDARPVADLLGDIRARRFSDQYQIWYSLGARATFAEAGPLLLEILESNTEYLHRYHCAAALISIARLDPKIYQPDKLSVGTPQAVREKIAELRLLLRCAPSDPLTAALPRATAPISTEPPPPLPTAPRSRLVTVFAWIVMILSALMLPISVISAAMLLVKSYGTASATLLGTFNVVFAPAIMLATGFGLWRRWTWAWFVMIGMLAFIAASNLFTILTVDRTPRTYISPSGVPTTVLTEGGASPLWPIVAIAVAAIVFLCIRPVRTEFFSHGRPR